MAKERADLTDAERAEVDRCAAVAFRARDILDGIAWALRGGAEATLEGVNAWLRRTDAENTDRLDELFGQGKGQG